MKEDRMPRFGRLKYTETDAWYHLYSRVAAHKGENPLSEAVPMRRLIQTIEHSSAIYFCEVAALCVMGSRHHLFDGLGVGSHGPRADPDPLRPPGWRSGCPVLFDRQLRVGPKIFH